MPTQACQPIEMKTTKERLAHLLPLMSRELEVLTLGSKIQKEVATAMSKSQRDFFLREQMRAIQPRGPYYLAGYSCGGVLAFEIAQQLTDQGEKVATLALLDSDLSTASPNMPLFTCL